MHVAASKSISVEKPNLAASIRRWLILAGVFFVPGYISLRLAAIADPDVYWHIRTGDWILQHHAFPRTDPFSVGQSPWIAYSWLFDLICHTAFKLWDLGGLLVLTVALTLLVGLATFSLVRRFQPDFIKSSLLTVLSLVAMAQLYTPRPWIFSIVLFAIQLQLLFATRQDGQLRRLLWLPPLYALVANIHVQFVYSLLVLGLAAAVASIRIIAPRIVRDDQPPARPAWIVWIACALAPLINPYGWGIYRVIAQYATGSVEQHITEMQAMTFREISHFVALGIVLFAFYVLGKHRVTDPFLWGLMIFSCYLGFRSVRDVWLGVLSSAAIIATLTATQAAANYRVSRLQLITAVLGAAVFIAIVPRPAEVSSPLDRRLASVFPVDAAHYIRQSGLSGPMFNFPDWGGFLIHYLPEIPVQTDGRTNVHSGQRLQRSLQTWNASPGWQSDPELARANLIIGSPYLPLTQLLATDPRFKLVYHDDVAHVFVRR
jgi:hypothetical protein